MTKIDFGTFEMFGPTEMAMSPVAADVYEEHIDAARMAEEVGYKYYFLIEHQNSPIGHLTSPNVYLAALAQRTTNLRFGVMIYQLPFHHPLRLAQDLATLDRLSRGRLEFGTGIGVHEHEFLRWNMPYAQRRAMAQESLEVIKKAWTEENVTHQGQYWQFDEALPYPRPYQQPHPPIWVACHSHQSFDYAAKHNYNVAQNINVDDDIADSFDYWRNAWKEHHHPGPMPRVFLTRHVHVAETDEQARAEAEPHLLMGFVLGVDQIMKTRIGMGSSPRGHGAEETEGSRRAGMVFSETRKSYDFWIDNGLALVGSPETVARKIEEQQARMGYDLFAAQHRFGNLPLELVHRSIRLFGEKVIPHFS